MDRLPLKELKLKLVVLILLVSTHTVRLMNVNHMSFSNDCYTFQLVGHLKQSRPGVRNALVKLIVLADYTLCVVTAQKEYLTRTQLLRGSGSQLFLSYRSPFQKVSRATICRWVRSVLTDSGIDTLRF